MYCASKVFDCGSVTYCYTVRAPQQSGLSRWRTIVRRSETMARRSDAIVLHFKVYTIARYLLKCKCCSKQSSSFICLFINEGWPFSGTFSISLCLLHFL